MSLLNIIDELKNYQIDNIVKDIESEDDIGVIDLVMGSIGSIMYNASLLKKVFNKANNYYNPVSPKQKIINFLQNKTKYETGNYSEKEIIRLWIKKTEIMFDSLTKSGKIKHEDINLKQQIQQELYGVLLLSNDEIDEKIEVISRQIIILILKTFSNESINLRNIKDLVSNNIENSRKQFKDYMIGWYKYVKLTGFINNQLFGKKPIEDAFFVITILSIYSYNYVNRYN